MKMRPTAYIQDALVVKLPDFLLPAMARVYLPCGEQTQSRHDTLAFLLQQICMVPSGFPGVLKIHTVL